MSLYHPSIIWSPYLLSTQLNTFAMVLSFSGAGVSYLVQQGCGKMVGHRIVQGHAKDHKGIGGGDDGGDGGDGGNGGDGGGGGVGGVYLDFH